MTYFQGFIIPVPEANREAYFKMAQEFVPLFTDYGAQRIVECWGCDVPRGELTDMYGAVKAEKGENIVFSWIDWGTKDKFDKAHEGMMSDKRMEEPTEMPFDGMRMIYSGFETVGESRTSGSTGYVQGYVAPVPEEKRGAFADMCKTMRDLAIDNGALRAADGWAADIEDGKVTDFKRAVKAKTGEAIAFGYAEWPSKDAFDQGSVKMRQDKRIPLPGTEMPMDGKRLIYGGFEVMLDTDAQ